MGLKNNFWKNKVVLVTGHEGFLGSWLTKRLVEEGARVVGMDKVRHLDRGILKSIRKNFLGLTGDVSDLKSVTKVINRCKPEVIFHLAAEAIVGKANSQPLGTFKSNIEGTWNILEAARVNPFIKSIVVASSDKAYGSHEKLPYTEEAALQGEHPYDVSKSCADLICRTYWVTFRVPVCVTRCGNIYGPSDYNFSRLVPDAVCSVLQNKQFAIRSNGRFTRDYIYVEDVVEAYMQLAQKMNKLGVQGEAFNFSCEDPLSVLDLYKKIVRVSGTKSSAPKILNQAQYEIQHQYLSSSKAKNVLGWKPKFSLEAGLEQTLHWYQNQLSEGKIKR
jgi:CDP-glucose 4,6-dehydratase